MAFAESVATSTGKAPAAPKVAAAKPAPGSFRNSTAPATAEVLARKLKLRYVSADALTLRRVRRGEKFSYVNADGKTIKDGDVLQRLKSLAMPPAYEDVLYAEDPRAHLQATGRDVAGRLQYRYHPEWQKVRETRKAARLARLAEALPRIRRSVAQHLSSGEPTREFTLAAVIELVARSAIRPGSESYARMRGTRGAATLLKSNVLVTGEQITLKFKAKGGKLVHKEILSARLAAALLVLRALPGRRLFQHRCEDGHFRPISAQEVNTFLREIAGVHISLKDFRTLLASVSVLGALANAIPADSKRARRRQVLDAIREAATELANTPAICAKSYVHEAVVTAFEEGVLEQFAETLRNTRSLARREQVLAQVVATAAA